jgi:hypothetical protein
LTCTGGFDATFDATNLGTFEAWVKNPSGQVQRCGTLGELNMPTRFLFFINRPDPQDPKAIGNYHVRWYLTPPNGRRHEIGRSTLTDPATVHPSIRPGQPIPPSRFVQPPPDAD